MWKPSRTILHLHQLKGKEEQALHIADGRNGLVGAGLGVLGDLCGREDKSRMTLIFLRKVFSYPSPTRCYHFPSRLRKIEVYLDKALQEIFGLGLSSDQRRLSTISVRNFCFPPTHSDLSIILNTLREQNKHQRLPEVRAWTWKKPDS